jgi:hypothetical protein
MFLIFIRLAAAPPLALIPYLHHTLQQVFIKLRAKRIRWLASAFWIRTGLMADLDRDPVPDPSLVTTLKFKFTHRYIFAFVLFKYRFSTLEKGKFCCK